MNRPTPVLKFHHANTLKEVTIIRDMIFTWFLSDAHKSTLIMGTGGALIPIAESPEQVEKAYLKGEVKSGKRK